jgi:hypothetical protein
MNIDEKLPVGLTLDQMYLIADSLDSFYKRKLKKYWKKETPRTRSENEELAFIQTTFQWIVLHRNIGEHKISDAVLESSGIKTKTDETETVNSDTGLHELAGDEGTQTTLS